MVWLRGWRDAPPRANGAQPGRNQRDLGGISDEIKHLHSYDVYEKVPIAECWNSTGKAPVKVKWVDINKGDNVNHEYRSRLVAKELKLDKRLDLFAATPPLEAKKFLFPH